MFENKKININLQNLIIFFSLSVVLIAWLGSLLAILGAFKILIPILFIIAGIFCILIKRTKVIVSIPKNEIVIVFFVGLLAITNGYFYHETIDHGRDHGAYISSAINIAKTGSFVAKEEYMHTYPSYFIRDGKIISLPYPAYPSFLAVVFSLLGIYGIFWSNTLFFLLFLLIMYLMGIEFGNKKIGLIFIAIFSTHYLTIWFTRRTNNETFYMLLLWFAVYLFIKGYTSKNNNYLILSTFPLSTILLVRPEGFFYYLSFSIALLLIFFKKSIDKKIIILSGGLILFLSIPLFLSDYTLNTIIRAVQESLPILELQTQQVLSPVVEQTGTMWEVFNQNIHRFTFDMFTYYQLTPLFLIIIIYLLKRNYNFLFILFLILISPIFYLIINPSISPDQPWFMRRFWPHIVVLLFFIPSIILGNMKLKDNRNKVIFSIILIFLLFSNLIYTSKIITFSEDRGLVEQLSNFDKKLPADVYIFGMEGKGNYWFLIPMHFLFDRAVINNKIEQEAWRTITIEELAKFTPEAKDLIVISPTKNIQRGMIESYFNDFDLKYLDNFTIKVPRMSLTADILGYQTPIPADIRSGKTRITYEWIEAKTKGTPPTNITTNTYELFIFKIYNNSKLELFKRNISLLSGWERKGEYLYCAVDECSFKSLVWNNSIFLSISYEENPTGKISLGISKSKSIIPLRNSYLSVIISPEKSENIFTISKGALIKNLSARYAKGEDIGK